jgi:hydrogenase maturation protease
MSGVIVILGIGNMLMSDDGVGVHAARELSRHRTIDARVVDAGTDVLSTLPFLELASRVLVLDAVHGGGRPGTIYRLAERDLPARRTRMHAHATSLIDARRLLSPDAPWPDISILGVEPAVLDYGMTLSLPVAAVLPQVVALARETVAVWRRTDETYSLRQVAS